MENIANAPEAVQTRTAEPAQGFDELLRERDFQSEFDRRISRALETAKGKWSQETQRQIEQARAEAEALARMSGEERMEHELAQRRGELDAREREVTRRELRGHAAELLSQRGLPSELAGALNYADEASVAQSLDAAESAFRAAVQRSVEERLRGSVPAAGPRAVGGEMSDEEYYLSRSPAGK